MDLWQLDSEAVEPHAPRVLQSDSGANRVILLALPAGEQLQDHQVHEHALVLLLEGEMLVRSAEGEQRLASHGLLHFDPAERHEVEAVTASRLLICLAPWPGDGHPSHA